MRRVVAGLLSAALASGVVLLPPGSVAAAPPPAAPPSLTPPAASRAPAAHPAGAGTDDLPDPAGQQRRALREQAVADVVSGRAKAQRRGASTVVKLGAARAAEVTARAADLSAASASTVGPPTRRRPALGSPSGRTKDRYVELSREATDRIFVILAEFGTERHPSFPDRDTDPKTPGPVVFDGPLHNAIPKPDRSKDNITNWKADYSPAHFRDLYFKTGRNVESLKTYYETQSSGRYSVRGKVTDWVKVRYNQARYGRSGDDPQDANGDDPAVCASTQCSNAWELIRDAVHQWVADQRAAGRSAAQITEELKDFDRQDRNDVDADGDFNEPDGYLDHFQIVYAGADEGDYNQSQGEDALWAHRWFANYTDRGKTGPAGNLNGGIPVADTGLWIGDYTMQPENGGLAAFAHEYAHDLDLPDDGDLSGLGMNNTGWWTLMGQPRLSKPGDGGYDTRAGDLGAWNKLQLGWLDYETVVAGRSKTLELGPEEYNTAKPQAVVVVLPKKKIITGAPYAGAKQFFSGDGDNLDTSLSRRVDLTGRATAALRFKARYAIEAGYDFLSVEASTDAGATWTPLRGTVNGAPFGADAAGNPAVDGTTKDAWVDVAVPLDAYAGGPVLLRLRYRTDEAIPAGGLYADDLTVVADGATVSTDGAEATPDWTATGFSVVGPKSVTEHDNFYIAGHRSYVSYDQYLKAGPYFSGYANSRPRFVDHYGYQEGLLISYWDTSQQDNNTNQHPGQGRNLYIDSRPEPLYNLTGAPWHNRLQSYDAPFSLRKAASYTLHVNGVPSYVRGQDAVPTFDDTRTYFYQEIFAAGVKLPAVGVKIKIEKQSGTSMKIKIS